MNKLRSLLQGVRDSLFFIPVVIVAICSGLAALSLYIDSRLGDSLEETRFLLAATISGGRSIATTVAGATMTVAAVVFSITALSSQIAANQYSPRAVRGFFEDKFQQIMIGLIVGTFTYSLLILGALSTTLAGSVDPVPSVSITVEVVLGVASAIGIVAYLDHSLRRFQIDAVVRRIADATLAAVKRQDRKRPDQSIETNATQPKGEPGIILAARSGWVQRIDPTALARSLPPDSAARVGVRLGEPVSSGDQLVRIWPDPGESDSVRGAVRKAITTARERSLDVDPGFGIRQLSDIGLKALSPGVNDPTTAVDVIHHLKVPIREILQSDPPIRVHNGPNGQVVYLTETLSRSDYVHSAFAEIRLAASSQPSVLKALLEVLGDLNSELEEAQLTGRMAALNEEIELTIRAARDSGLPKEDLARILGSTQLEESDEVQT